MPEVSTAPSLSALYAKAVVTGPTRRGDRLPDTEYVRRDVEVDRDHLAEYDRVCGFGLRDELPITYPHVLSFGLSVRLMTDPGFPFPLVGLVHVANRIQQERPLRVTDVLTQRVRVADLRPHPKGTQFDVVTETEVDGEVVWRETSTYLRRGRGSAEAAGQRATDEAGEPTATWRVPGDTGRRYAAVSGDRNPIHLNALAAKAFGFRRAIAHGMWSKARCLAALAERLPDRCTVDVEFRKPLLLPATVDFAAQREGAGVAFALRSRSGKPHLLGSVR
ncbi:MaoC family dehydratase [Saccharopolyspora hordei]|uniref:MaoC family dehydratase n=1 Tax=Saccharopolyspora hordei TaxID=1838 RepID=UPI0015CAC8CE|nr:MaoC/PaaZ C-terminal domain-containing protein [Saccharopolyspora hordei]